MDAQVAELVDALDLKSSDHCGRAGSIPAPGTLTKLIHRLMNEFFYCPILKIIFLTLN